MNTTTTEGKTWAIVGYFHLLGAIIAIVQNSETRSPFASFHIRQALGLTLLSLLLGILVSGFDSWAVSGAFYLFFFILWIYGFIGAVTGQMNLIPVLGPFFQKFFKNL